MDMPTRQRTAPSAAGGDSFPRLSAVCQKRYIRRDVAHPLEREGFSQRGG